MIDVAPYDENVCLMCGDHVDEHETHQDENCRCWNCHYDLSVARGYIDG